MTLHEAFKISASLFRRQTLIPSESQLPKSEEKIY